MAELLDVNSTFTRIVSLEDGGQAVEELRDRRNPYVRELAGWLGAYAAETLTPALAGRKKRTFASYYLNRLSKQEQSNIQDALRNITDPQKMRFAIMAIAIHDFATMEATNSRKVAITRGYEEGMHIWNAMMKGEIFKALLNSFDIGAGGQTVTPEEVKEAYRTLLQDVFDAHHNVPVESYHNSFRNMEQVIGRFILGSYNPESTQLISVRRTQLSD